MRLCLPDVLPTSAKAIRKVGRSTESKLNNLLSTDTIMLLLLLEYMPENTLFLKLNKGIYMAIAFINATILL